MPDRNSASMLLMAEHPHKLFFKFFSRRIPSIGSYFRVKTIDSRGSCRPTPGVNECGSDFQRCSAWVIHTAPTDSRRPSSRSLRRLTSALSPMLPFGLICTSRRRTKISGKEITAVSTILITPPVPAVLSGCRYPQLNLHTKGGLLDLWKFVIYANSDT